MKDAKLPHLNPVKSRMPNSTMAPSDPVYTSETENALLSLELPLSMVHSNSQLSICPFIHLSVCPSICTWSYVLPQWYLCQTDAVSGLCTSSSLPTGILIHSSNHRVFFSHLSSLPLKVVSVLRTRGLEMHPKCLYLQGSELRGPHTCTARVLPMELSPQASCILSGHSRIFPSYPLIFISHKQGNKTLCVWRGVLSGETLSSALFPQSTGVGVGINLIHSCKVPSWGGRPTVYPLFHSYYLRISSHKP